MPMRRKVYPGIGITVAIDQSTESGEGQIKAIDGMREEQRVSFRGFDGPQVVELDNEAAGFEKWGAGDGPHRGIRSANEENRVLRPGGFRCPR